LYPVIAEPPVYPIFQENNTDNPLIVLETEIGASGT